MKKIAVCVLFCFVLCAFLSGCGTQAKAPQPGANNAPSNSQSGSGAAGSDSASDSDAASNASSGSVVEIKDKFFIQQCNDIYNNPEQYKNKTIKIEGICQIWESNGRICYALFRWSPGCCGNDGQVGFRFTYGGVITFKADDWIVIEASVTTQVIDGAEIVVLSVSEITVKPEYGVHFVEN